MEKSITTVLEAVIDKLTNRIEYEVGQINDKNFPKNMTALKKVIDTVDKLILLNEKLSILKRTENVEDETLDETEKSILENYFKARLKSPIKDG